jgi:acetyltransferase-like isoleucine patch superfamily enzyme
MGSREVADDVDVTTGRARTKSFPSGSEASRAMVAEVSRAWQLISRINAVAPGDFAAMRAVLAELTGREVDASVRVLPPFYPDGGHNLRFGRNVFVNHGCTAVVVGGVEIGDDVMIGPNVQLISGGHALDPDTRRTVSTCAPVRIGRGVWIGAGATVLPGVTVGDDAVVAAGAVVTRDVAPRTLVGGVPATVMREL